MRRAFVWILVGVSVVGMVLGVIVYVAGSGSLMGVGWVLVGPLPMLGAGVYLMLRHPESRPAEWLTLAGAFSFALPVPLEAFVLAEHADHGPADWMWVPMTAAMASTLVGTICATYMVALLTDGRFRTTGERWYLRSLWLLLVFPPLLLVTNEFVVHEAFSFVTVDDVPSPFHLSSLAFFGPTVRSLRSVSILMFLGGCVVLWLRYRAAEPVERRKLRWVLFGVALAVTFGALPFVFSELGLVDVEHGWLLSLLYLPVLALPLSIVVTIEEPSWVDMDFVVRKSFVYAVLSVAILVLYAAVAAAFGLAAGTRLPVEVAIVLTVVVAIAFQPLKNRLQEVADRWVYGDRPTAYQVITDLDVGIGSADGPGEVLPLIADVVARTIDASWVRVRLSDGATVATGIPSGEAPIVAEMEHGGRRYGSIECGKRSVGRFHDDDERLVRAVAHQAALSMSNMQLASRLVNAQEVERRRIERNIHDGAQQELVALVAGLGMARSRLQRGELDPATLADLQAEATSILKDLRELAQGIHPSVLADGGLLEAIEDRCGRLPIEVSLDASEVLRAERYPDQVEGAAYFFVTEGLANVLKHAEASMASVALRRTDGRIELAIVDDGSGFDVKTAVGRGLSGLEDRIVALGGTMHIDSAPGCGTRIEAEIPVTGIAP